MGKEFFDIFNGQREKFIKQFGREPGPDDQIFFDFPPFEQIEHRLVEAMKTALISPSIIYAFEKTGFVVTEENQNQFSKRDLKRWTDAIEQFEVPSDDEIPF